MLDTLDFLADKGGDPQRIVESQKRRYASTAVVEEVQSLYETARTSRYSAAEANRQINDIQKKIRAGKKAGEDCSMLIENKSQHEQNIKRLDLAAVQAERALAQKLRTIGNYVHDTVPISNDESHNSLIRAWQPKGVELIRSNILSHHEVLTRINGFDPERGSKIVGHRGYCLTGFGLFLNDALAAYGKHFLHSLGYNVIQPPYMMSQSFMAKTAQLEQFHEELYKVVEDEKNNESDKYLIATSEQPISALHSGEWLQKKDLPIRYAGFSTCFRKEAGAHGRDAWGIFRVHQFEKIEQFLLTDPDQSWDAFEEMIAISEKFYQSLGLPYRVMSIVSGALNNAAAKKYDLEAWFPYQKEYKELVSCSNCTDYQARALEIRFGSKQVTESRKKYVHALNSTLCATERALCCVLENYQTEEGLIVPEVLRKYLPDMVDFIPYSKELPSSSTSKRAFQTKTSLPADPANDKLSEELKGTHLNKK